MADMRGTTQKQKWLEREVLRIHNAIEKDLDSYLTGVHSMYQRVYDTLEEEVARLNRDKELGRITNDYMEIRTRMLMSQLENRVSEINTEVTTKMPEKLAEYANFSKVRMDQAMKAVGTIALPSYTMEIASSIDYKAYQFQSSLSKGYIKVGQRLNRVLEEGMAKGWDTRKYSKEIQGIAKFTKFEADRVARTETARVATEGSRRSMKEYGVEKVRWSSALEKRTCQVCASLHGKTFRMGQEPPLPRHPFCRCVLIPVMDW